MCGDTSMKVWNSGTNTEEKAIKDCTFSARNKKNFGECAPTCSDGAQNGDETGVDCGGTACAACITEAPTAGE